MQDGGKRYVRLFRNRSFLALWLGQTVSFVGDYFYFLAIPIMVEKLTGSALQVGLSVIFSSLPILLLGPIAGVFVDRWDRKRTMIVSDLLRGLLVLVCLVVQSPEQVWIYYIVGFLMSCVSRFFFPAQNAVLPLIVTGEDDLLAANGLMQIVQTAGFLLGPALAGFSIGLWGAQVAFVVDSATYLISATAIVMMSVPGTKARQWGTGGKLAGVWSEMHDGIVYLFGNRTMVGVLLCLAVVQLGIGAIHVIWIPFMQRTFGLGAEGLGVVDAAQGVGMALGAVTVGVLAARFKKKDLAGWSIVWDGCWPTSAPHAASAAGLQLFDWRGFGPRPIIADDHDAARCARSQAGARGERAKRPDHGCRVSFHGRGCCNGGVRRAACDLLPCRADHVSGGVGWAPGAERARSRRQRAGLGWRDGGTTA
jgi:DHA3 family macrolide efflux protein-like MFS transporter